MTPVYCLALCLDDKIVIKWLRHGILATSVYLLLIFSVISYYLGIIDFFFKKYTYIYSLLGVK